jgi:condensin complex subunit 2
LLFNIKKIFFDQIKASSRGITTLETNLSNINAKKIDLEFSVDPLFRKTSASFDEGIE